VVTRDALLNGVWGFESYPSTRTVDNHVAGLRAKLERDAPEPAHIRTVHGVGYKFTPKFHDIDLAFSLHRAWISVTTLAGGKRILGGEGDIT
jgi:DNA-binding winged helix-turn-helix (wHTH) protein